MSTLAKISKSNITDIVKWDLATRVHSAIKVSLVTRMSWTLIRGNTFRPRWILIQLPFVSCNVCMHCLANCDNHFIRYVWGLRREKAHHWLLSFSVCYSRCWQLIWTRPNLTFNRGSTNLTTLYWDCLQITQILTDHGSGNFIMGKAVFFFLSQWQIENKLLLDDRCGTLRSKIKWRKCRISLNKC